VYWSVSSKVSVYELVSSKVFASVSVSLLVWW
jgi:hypothetical protein